MKANAIVLLLSWIWFAMIVASVVHPVLVEITSSMADRWLDQILYFFMWQSLAFIPGLGALVLRIFLQDRLTGTALWLGWIPGGYMSLAVTALSIYGFIAG